MCRCLESLCVLCCVPPMMCATFGALMHLLKVNFSSSSSSLVYSGLPSMHFEVDTRERRGARDRAAAAAERGAEAAATTAADARVCMTLG